MANEQTTVQEETTVTTQEETKAEVQEQAQVPAEKEAAEVMGDESSATAQEDGKGIPVKVNAGIKFKLLENNFVAVLQKDDKAVSILLAPTDAPGENGMTIQKMVDEIKGLMGAGDNDPEVKEMEGQLQKTVESVGKTEDGGSFKPMDIEIFLQQAFLYYRSGKDGDGNPVKNLEYAFSLRVDMSKMLGNIDVFNLEEITLSVWKTNRKKVTDSMHMFKIEDFLEEKEIPKKE